MTFQEFVDKYQKVPVEEYQNNVLEKVPNPIVSCRVSTYQHAPYIKQCLDGILMQKTNFPFEIVIGEDESSDGTREICIEYADKYPDIIRLFLHKRENNILIDERPSAKFQGTYTMYKLRGKYYAICEGDDYWTDPLKLQKQVDFLEKNSRYVGVGCFYNIIEEFDGNIVFKDLSGNEEFRSVSFNDYLKKGSNGIRTLTTVYRSDAIRKVVQKISMVQTTRAAGDVLLVSNLLKYEGDICLLPFNGAVYRKHVNGMCAGLIKNKSLMRKQHFYNYGGVMKTVLTSKEQKLNYWIQNFKLTIRSDIANLRFRFIVRDFLLIFI